MLLGLGFTQGESCPNVFWHQAKDICCSVHGDDFTSSGACQVLDWMEAEIAKHYEITAQPRMGPGPNDAKEGRSLNRVVRWLDGKIEYDADPRQSERLIAECGLEGAKGMAPPGVKVGLAESESDDELARYLTAAVRGPLFGAIASQQIVWTPSSHAKQCAGGCPNPRRKPGRR